MQNIVISTRIESLCVSQTSPVILRMQNGVISTRVTSLYGSQPSSVVLACKTASFGPELQFSMDPRPHLSFCTCKIAWFPPEWQVYIGSSPHLWFQHAKQRILDWNKKYLSHRCNLTFCASNQSDLHQNDKFIMVPALISCKTATLRPDLQVCMVPRPHLWVWAHITACLAQE